MGIIVRKQMAKFVKHFNKEDYKELFKRQDGICPYCGFQIGGAILPNTEINTYNVDHLVPVAVFKWTVKDYEDFLMKKEIWNRYDNLAVTHIKCNAGKNARIIKPKQFAQDSRCKRICSGYQKFYEEVEPFIEEFLALKERVYERQNHRCYCCNRPINFNTSTVRRLDSNLPRTEDNCILCCNKCNKER